MNFLISDNVSSGFLFGDHPEASCGATNEPGTASISLS